MWNRNSKGRLEKKGAGMKLNNEKGGGTMNEADSKGNVRRIGRWMALVLVFMLAGSYRAQAAWTQYDTTTRTYSDTANWAGGIIDDVFSSSSTAWAQTNNVTGDWTLTNGLSITRNPASAAAGNVAFVGSGADRIFNLLGPVNYTGSSGWQGYDKVVQLGNYQAGQRLILNLGATNRTFNIVSAPSDPFRGRGFIINGPVTGSGGLIKRGDGELFFGGTNVSTFTGALDIRQGGIFLADQVKLATTNILLYSSLDNPTNPAAVTRGTIESSSRSVASGLTPTSYRIATNTVLTSKGGALYFNGSTAATTAERLKAVVAQGGLTLFDMNAKASQSQSITVDTLTRSCTPVWFALSTNETTYGTNNFGTGAGNLQFTIGNFDASWLSGDILPFALIGNGPHYTDSVAAYTFASYDQAGAYVKPASQTLLASLATASASDNALITPGMDVSVTNGMTVDMNSLWIASTNSVAYVGTNTAKSGMIRLASGAVVGAPTNKRTDLYVSLNMSGKTGYVYSICQNNQFSLFGDITNATTMVFFSQGALYSSGMGKIYVVGNNFWTGPTIIAQGLVMFATALPSTNSLVRVDGGAYCDFRNVARIIGSLAGDGLVGTGSLTVGYDNTSTTFGGGIINYTGVAAVFNKVGTGTLTFGGTNYYSGTTTLSGGGLLVDGGVMGTGGVVSVQSGTLLGGAGRIERVVTVESNGTLTAAALASAGTLTLSTNLNLKSGAILDVTINATNQYDQIVVQGVPNLNSDSGVGSTLNVHVTGPVHAGQKFTIIDNQSDSLVSGHFNPLAISAAGFTIDYAGGAGNNDVVLTVLTTGTTVMIQ